METTETTIPGPVRDSVRRYNLTTRMSGQITSHTSCRPYFHGIVETLSGRLSSSQVRARCSRRHGTSAAAVHAASIIAIIPLTAEFLAAKRPVDLRQLKLCTPEELTTDAPQIHRCGEETGATRRRAMATRIEDRSSGRVQAHDMSGTVCQYAPCR
jgi:hypothetical protein